MKLMGFLDGTLPAPPTVVASSSTAGAEMVQNPAFVKWYDADQQLLSGLLSSMTEDILRDVITATSSKEVWESLQRQFSSSTKARTLQLRVQLATAKKRDLSAADYFRKIKGIAIELAVANEILRDDEVIAYLLAGLLAEYDPFVTSLTTRTEPASLDDVYAHLLVFEARQLQHITDMQLNIGSSANYAGRGGRGNHGRSRGGRGRSRGRGGAPRSSDRSNSTSSSQPICQICGKTGHTAVRCWHRNDESYNEDPPSAVVASTSYTVDTNWYNDTGATDHITSDLDRLTVRERYNGGEQVQVGNGAGLQILHIGHSSIESNDRALALRDVLHVPNITKNLLSVHKFTRDNDLFFEFHPWSFLVKDSNTRSKLLEGRCEGGLYPISSADARPYLMLS
jgi:hypothetical protein